MKMKKNGIAEIVFILDESGSMGPVRSDTIGGFNSTIQEHQGTGENIITTVILFSNEHRKLFDRVPIDEIPVMTELHYRPHGCTALCDTVAETITDIMSRQNAMPEETRPEKTMVFITTDGLENASTAFSADAVRKLISNAQENSGWKFVFYGADFDVVKTARSYGIAEADAMTFYKTEEGMNAMRVHRQRKLKDFLN